MNGHGFIALFFRAFIFEHFSCAFSYKKTDELELLLDFVRANAVAWACTRAPQKNHTHQLKS